MTDIETNDTQDNEAKDELTVSEDTKRMVGLLCHNLSCDIHNYFVHMIEQASKPEKGLTAEQLRNAAHDFATVLASIEMIIGRHRNFIINGSPDFVEEPAN